VGVHGETHNNPRELKRTGSTPVHGLIFKGVKMSSSYNGKEYVRCRECDSDFFEDSFKGSDLPFVKLPDNSIAIYTCPACGSHGLSKLFKYFKD